MDDPLGGSECPKTTLASSSKGPSGSSSMEETDKTWGSPSRGPSPEGRHTYTDPSNPGETHPSQRPHAPGAGSNRPIGGCSSRTHTGPREGCHRDSTKHDKSTDVRSTLTVRSSPSETERPPEHSTPLEQTSKGVECLSSTHKRTRRALNRQLRDWVPPLLRR